MDFLSVCVLCAIMILFSCFPKAAEAPVSDVMEGII